jgi:hypothetical protein
MPRTDAVRHPSAETLAAFENGTLPEERVPDVEAHLGDCDACCAALPGLPDGGFLARLRHAWQTGPTRAAPASSPLSAPTTTPFPPVSDDHPLPSEDPPLLPGFAQMRELGRGGMGVVYAATHALMGRRVAVKVIHPEFACRPDAAERFHREVHAAARLAHPNIVTAFDAGRCGDRLFLVMEYVAGESLADRLRRLGRLPIEEACEAVRQAALGVQHAHDNGLVHRDLKPHNLMRTAEGVVKVCDFGLAALAGDRGPAARATAPNAVLGTPDYMAPEQAEDARRADGRADVYSIGCTLFHLLTGTVPFPEESTLLKLLAHRTHSRPSARRLRPEVPPELDVVLRKALARDPDDRHLTPGELAQALAPFADPAHAARLRRQRRLWGLSALAAIVLLTGAAAAGMMRLPSGGDREIVIETDDPEVEVVVKGERIVRIADPRTGRTYQLDRDDLILTRTDEPDGLAVTLDGNSPVVLKREGKRIATIRLESKSGGREGRAERPFNEKDLAGWVVDGGRPGSWHVEDGELVGATARYPDWGFLLTERSYADFCLRFEYRLSPGANSGVALRAIPGEKNAQNSALPHHLEVQLLDDEGNRRTDGTINFPTGSLFWTCDPSHLRPDRLADLRPVGSWNQLTIESRGDSLKVWVNGRRVLSTDLGRLANQSSALPGLQRSSGRIGFQRHTGEARFRNIEIEDLSSAEKVGARRLRGLFNGRDLTGWAVEGDDRRFQVEDGVLVATSPGWQSRGYLLSEGQYANYRLRFECRLSEGANCGVVVRGRKGERSAFEQPGAIDHPVIKLTDRRTYPELPPGGTHWVASGKHEGPMPRAIDFPMEEWNAVEIEVKGTSCRMWVNKVLAVGLELDEANSSGRLLAGLARARGHVGFQANTGTARFRNIEISEIPPPESDGPRGAGRFFNSRDLTGWTGLPGYWRVEDGTIIGACPPGRPAHTFLVSDRTYTDFDLRFQVRRLDGIGNSGVQFRSRVVDWDRLTVVGPQCEIESAGHSFPPGSLLTEPDCTPLAEKAPRAAVAAKYRDADFNEFHIRCVGKHVTIRVNGVTAIDDDYPDLPDRGALAWQMHGSRTPREVVFRNIEFTDLSAGGR